VFNEDQRAHMAELAATPAAEKCWCGWNRIGQCLHCPSGKTLADRVAVSCPKCRGSPSPDGSRPIVHVHGCERQTEAEREYYRSVMAHASR